jgi:hypothetical protein
MTPVMTSRSGPKGILVDRYRLLFRLQILSAVGCSLIILYGLRFWFSGDLLRIVGIGLLIAGASLMAGFLLGFVFGIPRDGSEMSATTSAADPRGSTGEAAQGRSNHVRPNSNLIEISDWLTKIIVGVGLVELKSIPSKLGTLSYYLGLGLRPAECTGPTRCTNYIIGGQAAGLAIFIFYVSMGFLWGYVWTRLYFTRDLEEQLESLRRENENLDIILGVESLVKEGRLDEAMRYIDKVLENSPRDGRAVLTKGRILKRQADESNLSDTEKKKLLSQAVEFASRAIELLPGKGEPMYNKACYQALLGVDKKEVLANLKSAFTLNPRLRKTAAEDGDLTSLQQDDDFKRLISEE